MKIILISLTVFSIFAISAVSQNDSLNLEYAKPFGFSVETGTSFSSLKGVGSGNSYFIVPGLSLKPSPKWNLNVKTFLSRQSFNPVMINNPETRLNFNSNSMYVSLYADGEYSFNEKLHVRGVIMKNLNNTGYCSPLSLYNSGLNDFYSIGMYYNLTKNIQLGAEIRYMDFNSLNYYNPFYLPY